MKIFRILLIFSISMFAFSSPTFAKQDIKPGQIKEFLQLTTETINHLISTVEETNKKFKNKIQPIFKKIEKDSDYILTLSEDKALSRFWKEFNMNNFLLNAIMTSLSEIDPKRKSVAYFIRGYLRYAVLATSIQSGTMLVKSCWNSKEIRNRLNNYSLTNFGDDLYQLTESKIFSLYSAFSESNTVMLFFSRITIKDARDKVESFLKSDKLSRNSKFHIRTTLNKIAPFEKYISENQEFLASFKNKFIKNHRKVSNTIHNIYYSIFSFIATVIGDTKIYNFNSKYIHGDTGVSENLINLFINKLESGDIVISKTYYYLSNLFLDGEFIHSALFLDTPQKFTEYFQDDAETNDHYAKRCQEQKLECTNFMEYLKDNLETTIAWREYLKKPKKNEHPNVIIEAISEGVVLSNKIDALKTDTMAAIRPKLSKLEKARAIEEAMSRYNTEYDFDFDFKSTQKIVCSELIFKVYQPDKDMNKKGITFHSKSFSYFARVHGNLAMPSSQMIQKMYDEKRLKKRKSELEFIAYVKGDGTPDEAIFLTEDDLYKNTITK